MRRHEKLREKAKQILLDKGFKSNEIHDEYTVTEQNGTWLVVDVVGDNNKQKIAIECGNIGFNRIEKLKQYFDEVIHIPYVKRDGNKIICLLCDYVWRSRVESPKECPRCKSRLDYPELIV